MRKFRRVLFLKLARMMRALSARERVLSAILPTEMLSILTEGWTAMFPAANWLSAAPGRLPEKFRRKVWNFTANLMARWQWKTCLSPVRHGLSATRYIRRLRLNRAQCWKENARFPKEMQRRLRIRKPVPARSSRQAGKRERVPKAACGWPTGRRKQVLATSRRPAGRRKQVSATGRRPTEGRETPG